MTYLTRAACDATTPLDNALILFAQELEAHKALIEKLETQIQSLHAQALDRNMDERDTDIREMDERLEKFSGRLDEVECSLEDKLDSMDLDERVRETLQNVTFTVSVD